MKHNAGRILIWGMILLTVTMAGCGPAVIYDEQVDIPSTGWPAEEAVRFEIPVNDTLIPYHFSLQLQHNSQYRFSNFYFFLTTTFPDGKLSRDTVEVLLAEPSGKWLGKGWGDLREVDLVLRDYLIFPQQGNYQFLVQQAMRADTLQGVSRLGMRLTEAVEPER